MRISFIEASIPFRRTIVVLRFASYWGILSSRHICRQLLVPGTGHVAWERCLRARRKKRGGTCHCLHTAPQNALRCLGGYNTSVRKIFPLRKHDMWSFVWPCSRRELLFVCRFGNNMAGGVYWLHSTDRAGGDANLPSVWALWFPNRTHRTCSESDSYYGDDRRPAKRFRREPLWLSHDCRLAPALPRSCSDSAFRPVEATGCAELKRSE